MSAQYPDDLYYTKDHEWARIEDRDGQKLATIGVSRFAVDQLGDVTQVDLPKEGESVKQAEVFGSVESVKAVSDLFAPLSGKILKVNSPLADSPEYVNEDPYDEGWMIQLSVSESQGARRTARRGGVSGVLARAGGVTGGGRSRQPRAIRRSPHRPRCRRRRGDAAHPRRRYAGRAGGRDDPRGHSICRHARSPRARGRGGGARRAARARRQERRLEVVHRPRLLELFSAAGHSAQHPREPRLVHAVHALPGRNLARAAGSAAQLPDHGGRPDRAARGQCFVARRSNGGRRSHAHAARAGPGAGKGSGPARRFSWSRTAAIRRRSRW